MPIKGPETPMPGGWSRDKGEKRKSIRKAARSTRVFRVKPKGMKEGLKEAIGSGAKRGYKVLQHLFRD